jgi:hypothetical protein
MEAVKQDFIRLVKYHDVTYDYSDDSSVRRNGGAQLYVIKTLAAQLPLEFVTEVWNKKMDEYFVAEEAPNWYWKG